MAEILALVLVGLFVVLQAVQHRMTLADEKARVNDLLRLLEAKAAPAEVAAYLTPPAPEETGEWIFSDDGLISVRVDD